jgi:hypothetical protein
VDVKQRLDRNKGLWALPEVAFAFPFNLVIGAVVNDLRICHGGFGGAMLDMVAGDMRHDCQIHPGGVPPVPAKEEILSSTPVVTSKVAMKEGFLGKQGASQSTPIGRNHGSQTNARISEVHPSSASVSFGIELKDIPCRGLLLDPFPESMESPHLAFPDLLIGAGF